MAQRDHSDQLEEFSWIVWKGKQRGMTRREFLKVGLALGLSLPSISAILTACGVDTGPASSAAVPPAASPTPTTGATATPLPPTATSEPTSMPTATSEPTSPPTATPMPQQVRLGVIGDFGWAGEAEAAVAALVKSWNPDCIVTTGDNNYPLGAATTIDDNIGQYYHEYMGNYKGSYGPGAEVNRFFPVLGNHDTDTELGQPYFDYFTLPNNERYYVIDMPPVRIYAVNSVAWVEPDGVYNDSVQAAWLREELAASPDTWNLVFFHHPPYSSGYKGSSSWMRWDFEQWGAHATFSGHNHVYERYMENDFPHFVNGLGGGPRYAFAETIDPNVAAYFNANHGAQLVEATEEQITFQFITPAGEVIDSYTRTKSG
jgi:hypothetical protein